MINDENSRSTDDSSSSMQLQYSSDDLTTNSEQIGPVNTCEDVRTKGRANKILKLLSSSGHINLESPAISRRSDVIDLTEKSDSNVDWLQTKFAINSIQKRKSGESRKAVPVSLVNQKKKLLTSIALKRKEAQAKRKEMYHGDNEDIMSGSEPEEEDYESDGSEESEDQNDDQSGPIEALPITVECLRSPVVELDSTEQPEVSQILSDKDPFILPSSLSQWCETPGQDSIEVLPVQPLFDDHSAAVDDDELLLLCSGQFDPIPAKSRENDEETTIICKKRGARITVQSDDEDETEETFPHSDPTTSAFPPESADSIDEPKSVEDSTTRRVVISDDEDDNEDCGESSVMELDDCAENGDEEESDNDSDTEKPDVVSDSEESNVDDSDDELAVIKKLEKKEYKKKSRSSKFFDDEASLSGDDVGSDVDGDLDGEDDYEREEGDDDDVPDANTIALENHRRLLKEEQDKSHREIAKLQERLLPDGDLSAVQTNRTFRVRLREEVEFEEDADGEANDDDADMDDDEDYKGRIEALKLRLELQERMAKEAADTEHENSNDPLEFAANAALSATAPLLQKSFMPSLLNRAPLANAFKDMSNAVTAKQLYTRTENTNVNKRSQTSTLENPAKKPKTSVLASLED